jgi:ribosomal protein L18E
MEEMSIPIKKEPSLPELVDRLEKANVESKELLAKNQELIAKRLIGGETDATPVVVKKVETPAEYAKRVMTGSLI